MSSSHKRLYEKWTFPAPASMAWMTREQKQSFESILREMNGEILRLIDTHKKRRPGYEGNGPESMVHMLELALRVSSRDSVDTKGMRSRNALSPHQHSAASSSTITPSRAKNKLSVKQDGISRSNSRKGSNKSPILPSNHDSGLGSTFSLTENHVVNSSIHSQDQHHPLAPSQSSLHTCISSASADYSLNDLPLRIRIRRSTFSHVLRAGNVEYVFDLESIDAGELLICRGRGEKMVDVRRLETERAVCVDAGAGCESLTFWVCDREDHEMRVTIIWEDP